MNPHFFAITSTQEVNINKNLKIHGRYRPINFEIGPFNLNSPFTKLDDGIKDGMKDYLNVYETKKINI